MSKGRLEAFSDGVIAIIITIMVLELKVPHGSEHAAVCSLVPIFFSYVLSFILVGIYWANHHHLFQVARKVNGAVLWANLHLLFWLSLIPFVTERIGEHTFNSNWVAVYGVVLFCAGGAYYILTWKLRSLHGERSQLVHALGRDTKGKISVVLYALAIGLAYVHPYFSYLIYAIVEVMWLIPDRRLEKELAAISS